MTKAVASYFIVPQPMHYLQHIRDTAEWRTRVRYAIVMVKGNTIKQLDSKLSLKVATSRRESWIKRDAAKEILRGIRQRTEKGDITTIDPYTRGKLLALSPQDWREAGMDISGVEVRRTR